MITLLCVGLFVVFLLLHVAWYMYDKYKIAKKEIKDEEVRLNNYADFIRKRERENKEERDHLLADVVAKKARLDDYYQYSLEKLTEAQKMDEAAQFKIKTLQKQVAQLQSELHNARQRAKRLAKKSVPQV